MTRIAYNQACCKERSSIEEDLALCSSHGIKEIELRFDMIQRYLQEHSRDELSKLFVDTGVRPITLNAIFNINFLSEEQRDDIRRQLMHACELGDLLNVDCVIVLPSEYEDVEKYGWPRIKEDTIQNLRWMGEICGKNHMRIAFEPIGFHRRCVRSIRSSWEIICDVNMANVGLALDAYNLYMYDALRDVDDLLEIDAEKVFIVHLDDADPSIPYDQLGTFDRKIPGDGSIDLERFIRAFETIGYEGAYSIELLNQEYWRRNPEELFHEAFEKTTALLKKVKGISQI